MEFFAEVELDEVQAQLLARAMLAVAQCEGGVHERELALIKGFYGDPLVDPSARLTESAPPIEPGVIARAFKGEAARLFVKSCLLMGYADGKYGSGEKALVGAYAAALGMNGGELEELEQSVREFLLSQVAHLKNTGVVVEIAKKLGV